MSQGNSLALVANRLATDHDFREAVRGGAMPGGLSSEEKSALSALRSRLAEMPDQLKKEIIYRIGPPQMGW